MMDNHHTAAAAPSAWAEVRHAPRYVLRGVTRFVGVQSTWRRAVPAPASWLRAALLGVELVAVLGAEALVFQAPPWGRVLAVVLVAVLFGMLGRAAIAADAAREVRSAAVAASTDRE